MGPGEGRRAGARPAAQVCLGPCLRAAHVNTCTHMHTRLTLFTELPVKQPNQGLSGTWRQRGTTLSQKPNKNSQQPKPPNPGSSGNQPGDRPLPAQGTAQEGPPDSWAPQIPQASPSTPSIAQGEKLPRLQLSHLPGGSRHSVAAPDPRIPSQPASPGGLVQPLAALAET